MNLHAHRRTIAANRDAVALARAYQHDDKQGAAQLIANLDPQEQAITLAACANLLGSALECLAQHAATPFDQYIDTTLLAAIDHVDRHPPKHRRPPQ